MTDEIIDLCDSDNDHGPGQPRTTSQNYCAATTYNIDLRQRRLSSKSSSSRKQQSLLSEDQSNVSSTSKKSAPKSGTLIDLPRNSDSDSDDSGDEYFNRVVIPPPFRSMHERDSMRDHRVNDTKHVNADHRCKQSLKVPEGGETRQTNSVVMASDDKDLAPAKAWNNVSSLASFSVTQKTNLNPNALSNSKESTKDHNEIIILSSDDDNDDIDEDMQKKTNQQQEKKFVTTDSDDDSIFNSPTLFASKKRSIPPSWETVNQRSPKRGFGGNMNSPMNSNELLSPTPIVAPAASMASTSNSNLTQSKEVPTPTIPQIDVTKIGGKLYPDHRHEFIRALIAYAKRIRNVKHQKSSLDSCIQAIVNLSLYNFPVRTAHAASSINGVGGSFVEILSDAEGKCKGKPFNPPRNMFSSVAPAVLVSLLEFEQHCFDEEALCSMEELLTRINQKVHNHQRKNSPIFPEDVTYYLNKNNFDPSWMQVLKLCNENTRADRDQLIKLKKRKKVCNSGNVFELTGEGRRIALRLQVSLASPVTPPGPLRQLASETVNDEYGNVTLSMDFREGGGTNRKLHDMCNFLDQHKIPYVVRNLKISDYVFFVGDKLAPVLIERKSIEDLAQSISDGRWKSQQHSMRKAQFVLGGGSARRCQLCYLIEGEINSSIVHGGYIGRRAWNIKEKDIEDAITELPLLGFSVMRTKTKMGSLDKVSKVAKDVLWKARNRSIDCTFTYDEFIKAVERLGEEKGNPPSEREHQNPAPPIAETHTPLGRHVARFAPDPTAILEENSDGIDEGQNQREEELGKLSIAKLKEMCEERDEKKSGTKKDLIARLLQKRKPEILITRARRKQYVPKLPSCNAAILVAILLHNKPGATMKKEDIMNYAQETGISKDPMFGNGKSFYDGWSGIKDLTGGDPPLVSVVKRKYALTTQPHGAAGIDVAKAILLLAQRKKMCGLHIAT